MQKTIYSKELKQKAAELFAQRGSNGKRVYTGKKLASELGVSVSMAYYLEYTGRQMLGILPPKRYHKPRSDAGSKRGKRTTQEEAENFVENNVYTGEETLKRSSRALVVYGLLIGAASAFVLSTYLINWIVQVTI